jgi:hypothetical protein
MRFAYIVSKEPFDKVAELVRSIALPGHEIEERDGLNIGGGQYFKIFHEEDEIILCRAEYGDPPEEKFTHCLYAYLDKTPGESRIEPVVAALKAAGIDAAIEQSGDA